MGAVDTTYTFTATDTITSAKMNNIIDQTTITTMPLLARLLMLRLVSSRFVLLVLHLMRWVLTLLLPAITDANVTTAKIADSNVITSKIADANITAPKLSGAQTGTAPIFGIRAFGAFNGTASTPISPISAGNIASIVRNSVGTYTITLTTAMSDANYCVVVNEFHRVGSSYGTSSSVAIINSSSFTIQTGNEVSGGPFNSTYIGFLVI
jgi:hypothetical protein